MLRLSSEHHWAKFRCALGNCLLRHGKLLKEVEAENDVLLEAAETKDKRQAKLDHFFREAYSRAFNVPQLSDHSSQYNTLASEQIMNMTLTKAEFAEALGMRAGDLFVQRMFACMARDEQNDTVVTFQEFLDVLRKFTQGSLKEKLQLVFDMCDLNKEGCVQRHQFCEFVKSLNMAAGVRIDQDVGKMGHFVANKTFDRFKTTWLKLFCTEPALTPNGICSPTRTLRPSSVKWTISVDRWVSIFAV